MTPVGVRPLHLPDGVEDLISRGGLARKLDDVAHGPPSCGWQVGFDDGNLPQGPAPIAGAESESDTRWCVSCRLPESWPLYWKRILTCDEISHHVRRLGELHRRRR